VVSHSVIIQLELAGIELLFLVLLESHSIFQLFCLFYAAPLDEFMSYHEILELHDTNAKTLLTHQKKSSFIK